MSDFAPNYTARYRFHYSQGSKSHTMMWRVAAGVTDPSALATKIGLFLDDMSDNLYNDFTITSADFALADSDVFLPATPPSFGGGAVAASGAVLSDAAYAMSFIGRSIAGGRARMFLYGSNFGAAQRVSAFTDYRILSSELSTVSAAVVRLNETSPPIVANDNENVVWYEYVNLKPNDAWVRKLRRG
jgi:hypothetical protein